MNSRCVSSACVQIVQKIHIMNRIKRKSYQFINKCRVKVLFLTVHCQHLCGVLHRKLLSGKALP